MKMDLWGTWVARLLVSAALFGFAPARVVAQNVRPPELSMQYHRAETAWKSGGSVLEAKARVDRVLAALPEDVEARRLRAQVLLALHRPEEALVDARRAVELDPEDGESQLILCEAARLAGSTRLATQALDAAAELVVDDAPFHLRLSLNAELLDELDKAESFARIALAMDSTDAAAYYQLARIFGLKEQPNDAAAVLMRGLRSSILDRSVIESDSVLARLARHPDVLPLMRP